MNADQQKLWSIASSFDATPKQLTQLSASLDSHLLRLISQNPNTPDEILIHLAGNISPYVRYGVARNVNIPKEALCVLANNKEYDILKKIAENPNAPVETLLTILNGNHVRQDNLDMVVCANVALSTNMIKRMLPTASLVQKRGFAVNPNTPPKVLCAFAADDSPYLRYSIALREIFPLSVCEIIKNDDNVDVQKALFENDFVPNIVIEHMFDNVPGRLVELVAKRERLPQSVRGKIIYGDNRFAKVNLLKSDVLTANELDYLVKDESHFVRMEVAKHVNISDISLRKLINDPSTQVILEVIRNPSVSEGILKMLSMHPSSHVRREVALNERISNDLSYDLSADESIHVKIALIRNPKAPLGAVTELVLDQDESVSRMAKHMIGTECVINSKYEYMAY